MIEHGYTWRAAVADAHTAAAESFAYAVESGEDIDDAGYETAHEFADGSAWVIYYYRAACLWMDSGEVQAAEDEACSGMDASADIHARIAACVYSALVAEYLDYWRDLAETHADSEGVTA